MKTIRLRPLLASAMLLTGCEAGKARALGSHASSGAPDGQPALLSAAWRAPPAIDGQGLPARTASAPPNRPAGYLKGQLHMHTNHSGDSDTPPDVAVRWYEGHGFDFVVITDHNTVTIADGQAGMLVLPGIELTQNLRTCDPPPLPAMACLLHVNGLFVNPALGHVTWPVPPPSSRSALYERAVGTASLAGGIAMLNHPNFQYAADADLVVSLAGKGLGLLEVRNEALDSENAGDAAHPSTEALWDAALTRGARVFGTATDDAHHYDDADAARSRGETAYVGNRGFVMVHAEKSPGAIRAAIERGDFYGSTGLLFDELKLDDHTLHVRAKQASLIEVVGTGGVLLGESRTGAIDFDETGAPRGYVRVRARDLLGHVAFTQPVMRP